MSVLCTPLQVKCNRIIYNFYKSLLFVCLLLFVAKGYMPIAQTVEHKRN